MKKRRVFSLLAAIFVICMLLSPKAAAVDTPWMAIQPDTGTAENASVESPQTTSETQAGDPAETVDLSDALMTNGETGRNTDSQKTNETDPAPESIQKRGCGSTVAGRAMLLPVLLSVLFIGSNVSQKRE